MPESDHWIELSPNPGFVNIEVYHADLDEIEVLVDGDSSAFDEALERAVGE